LLNVKPQKKYLAAQLSIIMTDFWRIVWHWRLE